MDDKNIILPVVPARAVKYYGAMEEEYTSAKKSKVAILQIPYEKTATYLKGTRNGPSAIIDASKYMELFDDELNQETFKIGIHTMDPLSVEELSPEEMVERVHGTVAAVLQANKFPVILGGEHSVTIGAVKAFSEAYQNFSVLHLDAHYDLRNEYFGSKLNHGCVTRRITEMCPVVQAGTRSFSKEEKEFAATQPPSKLKILNVYDILDTPMWKDIVSNNLTENVYITIDMDVFDPAIVPAVGTPEPGGLGWYEMLELLKEVAKDKKIVGFDVVELCPIKGQIASDFLAAKLIYRLLGYIFSGKK